MLRRVNPMTIAFAGGGVYPERSRGARHVADTVQIHINTILTARESFAEAKPQMHTDQHGK